MNIRLAGCVIENSEGQILLLHRNTPKRIQWELPGGKIEKEESAENAAVREIEEELGIKVSIIKKLGEKSFEEDGFIMSYLWFEARIIEGAPMSQEEKFDSINYFSWAELKNKNDLSANTKNLVQAYYNKKISV